jgi:hypothetical protein
MSILIEREEGARLAGAVEALLAAEPYLAYANFAPIAGREGALLALHRRWWLAAADGLGVLVAREASGRPLAMLRLEHRAFESEHFGMPVAKIDVPAGVADEADRLGALRALYAAAAARLRELGYRHLTAGASAQDRAGCWAVQELGAFHVGTRISWLQPLTGEPHVHALAPGLRVASYQKPSIPSFEPRAWRRLLDWTAVGFDRGPFVFDLAVDRERAARIYRVWTEKAMTGEWADALLLVWDGDEVIAFHTMMLLPELSEAAGVGMLGRGIGGTLPGYRGLFTALQRETAAVRPLGAAYLENEAQTATIGSIQVFGRLGHQCIRSTGSYHMRL